MWVVRVHPLLRVFVHQTRGNADGRCEILFVMHSLVVRDRVVLLFGAVGRLPLAAAVEVELDLLPLPASEREVARVLRGRGRAAASLGLGRLFVLFRTKEAQGVVRVGGVQRALSATGAAKLQCSPRRDPL